MKLPDFKLMAELNALKAKMGIPKNVYGDLSVELSPDRLTLKELDSLNSNTGLEISIDGIIVRKDGTLSYKGKQVVVYIRDKSQYGLTYNDPRFHLANCATLIYMRHNKQFGKFVATSSKTGIFEMNIMRNNNPYPITKKLSVCQNCLDFLRIGNFSLSQSNAVRENAVANFSLHGFFETYSKTFHLDLPKYDAETAPINSYGPGFSETSAKFKARNTYLYQELTCGVDLSKLDHRKYLHTHHINAEKYDNNESNLRSLCIYCHANMPMHQHLKSTKDYNDFIPIRQRLLSQR